MMRWVLVTTFMCGWSGLVSAKEPVLADTKPTPQVRFERLRIPQQDGGKTAKPPVHLQVRLIERLREDEPKEGRNTVRRVLNPEELKPFVQELTTDSQGKIVAEPALRLEFGKEGRFRSGTEFVLEVPNSKPGEPPTEEELFFGTTLDATVTMSKPGLLNVEFRFEHSERIDKISGGIPEKRARTVQSRIDLQNGQTMVLDGLVSHRSITIATRHPVLGEIPIVGEKLFVHRRTEHQCIEMVVLVTATLVEEPAK